METESRTLEITILSAEDLRIGNKPVKKNAFVIVSIDSFNNKATKIDRYGGSYPSWNDKLVMDMPMQTSFITLQVKYCKGSSGGEKPVGFARIPVTDFIGGYSPETCLQYLSYRLRDPKGLKNGIINICLRLKEALHGCSSQAAAASASGIGLGIPIDGRRDLGVVTGIPIWSGYPSNSLSR
ncbi:putative RING/U-box superfamily protein [Hibiscus syriacus]|uniref:RING/U-box superfamily protein n=1 Tax=Hibiscus syriacus TaxID=106335 RepID=A0A6A3C5S8_HIBSY|nr:BON1-associated protein 2-like [Hibiscus syriacus]KAE8723311.1 putative RING/U-box superfamily protein [Hibiscus syriacus]